MRHSSASVLAALLLTACSGPRRMPVTPAAPLEAAASSEPATWRHDWARGAVFYEVFVRSFSDADGDGVGDLRGLTAKLDYLNDGNPATHDDLGVDALWLMPIFASPSYHGYDTTDYEHVNPAYGSDADFDALLAAAHRRGLKVIVDLVLNHTSSQHPWFVEADGSPNAARRDWYVWRTDDPGWTQPWGGNNHTWHAGRSGVYYGVFWGGMPDLNWRNPQVRSTMAGIAARWLARGVDGFRLDATRHLVENGPDQDQVDQPETHAALREFSAAVRRAKPESILVGENWTESAAIAAYYGDAKALPGGDELPMSFDFPLAGAIVDSVQSGRAESVEQTLRAIARFYPAGALDAPFLTNHDMRRVASTLQSDARKLRSAAAVLLTLPGAPFLYYGEELGLQNGPGGDDTFKRTPMPWNAAPGGGFSSAKPWFDFAPGRERENVAAETGDARSLLSHYRRWVALRHSAAALRDGDLELISAANPAVLAFTRTAASERVLVAHNLSGQPQEATLALVGTPSLLTPDAEASLTGESGHWTLRLAGGASAVFRLAR